MVKDTLTNYAFVEKSADKLDQAQQYLAKIKEESTATAQQTQQMTAIANYLRLHLQILTAQALVLASLERKESRGSHYRIDYPQPDPSQNSLQILRWHEGHLCSQRLDQHAEKQDIQA